MKRPSLGFVLALAGALLLAAGCTDVTVNRSPDGTISGGASGPDVPPVEIDNDGIREVTPEPGPTDPIYPVTPPAPTRTPRPG